VGSLTLPDRGSIYLDSSVVIYSVERIEPYLTLLAPVWRQAEAGSFTLFCSELILAEALVQPIRRNRPALEAAFETSSLLHRCAWRPRHDSSRRTAPNCARALV